ncbi:MAG: hypothetical protein BWK80_11040 [Desulfobacteraceae bacterium IS3]|nr:MAG: hypothetical protein BWK80_11040 [Desulfobacteraceae bacterium IS3]
MSEPGFSGLKGFSGFLFSLFLCPKFAQSILSIPDSDRCLNWDFQDLSSACSYARSLHNQSCQFFNPENPDSDNCPIIRLIRIIRRIRRISGSDSGSTFPLTFQSFSLNSVTENLSRKTENV